MYESANICILCTILSEDKYCGVNNEIIDGAGGS